MWNLGIVCRSDLVRDDGGETASFGLMTLRVNRIVIFIFGTCLVVWRVSCKNH